MLKTYQRWLAACANDLSRPGLRGPEESCRNRQHNEWQWCRSCASGTKGENQHLEPTSPQPPPHQLHTQGCSAALQQQTWAHVRVFRRSRAGRWGAQPTWPAGSGSGGSGMSLQGGGLVVHQCAAAPASLRAVTVALARGSEGANHSTCWPEWQPISPTARAETNSGSRPEGQLTPDGSPPTYPGFLMPCPPQIGL